jgi:hypothetical protein
MTPYLSRGQGQMTCLAVSMGSMWVCTAGATNHSDRSDGMCLFTAVCQWKATKALHVLRTKHLVVRLMYVELVGSATLHEINTYEACAYAGTTMRAHQGAHARASCSSTVSSSTGARGRYLTTYLTYSRLSSKPSRPEAMSSTRPAQAQQQHARDDGKYLASTSRNQWSGVA